MENYLERKAGSYLKKLCAEIPERQVGSDGNRAATVFFEETIASFGFVTERQEFDCMDWRGGEAALTCGDKDYSIKPSPYSLGCIADAPLAVVCSAEELEIADIAGKIVLLHGEIAKEQLMPKNFVFYNPDEHQKIIRLLEEKRPAAIVSATARNPESVGALYPFPLIEDGDFDIPSVYTTDTEGERLSKQAGRTVSLRSETERRHAKGWNVSARKQGSAEKRIVICAHIDSRMGTPGALDNAAGVAASLLTAELLKDYRGYYGVEIVAINGEDYYAVSGEMKYIEENDGRFGEILFAINIDGAGFIGGDTAFSFYECPKEIEAAVREVLDKKERISEGPQWVQGDHGMFIYNGVPAIAFTTTDLDKITSEYDHSENDTPEAVDPALLAGIAETIRDIIERSH